MKLPTPKKLPSGSWNVQVMVDGNRVSITAPTEKEALARAAEAKAGMLSDARREREADYILRDAIKRYIEARQNVLSPSTVTGYEEILRNRFQDIMGLKLSRIGLPELQRAVNQEAGNGLSKKTIKNALGLVAAVMAYYGRPVNNQRVKLPQGQRKEHSYLDVEGIIDLFDRIKGDTCELPILMAVWLGMRRSEIMGLCWDSVDFDSRSIQIRRTYVKGRSGYVLREALKTEASRRVLDCPAYIMEKLAAYRPGNAKPADRVFRIHPNTIYRNMKKICDRNGIDFVGVHGLRHTNASVMLSLGIVDKVAMARGGWSTDITMKQIYQHVFAKDKSTAGEKVDHFFEQVARGINPQIADEFADGRCGSPTGPTD